MTAIEIKKVIRKYRNRAVLYLTAFSAFAIISNYFFIQSTIDRHLELGLAAPELGSGYILSLLLMGLYVVLITCFWALEGTLLKLLAKSE